MREFLHVNDLGQALLFALENTLEEDLYNVGTGVDITIRELARLVQSTIGHKGSVIWDNTKPDGTPRKLMDNDRINREGWKAFIDLKEGVLDTYDWYLENHFNARK